MARRQDRAGGLVHHPKKDAPADNRPAKPAKRHDIIVLRVDSEGQRGSTGLSETLRVHGVRTDGRRIIRRGAKLRVIADTNWTPRARNAVMAYCTQLNVERAAA